MDVEMKIYQVVDLLFPAQKLSIHFDYTSVKGLEFVHSMALRFIQLDALSATDLARALMLSETETCTLLNELLDRGEIQQCKDEKYVLTSEAQRYFSSLGSVPIIEEVKSQKKALAYDVIGYNCLNSNLSTHMNGLKITLENSQLSNTEEQVREVFKQEFSEYVESGKITFNVETIDDNKLYKINKVEKTRDGFIRVSLSCFINTETAQLTCPTEAFSLFLKEHDKVLHLGKDRLDGPVASNIEDVLSEVPALNLSPLFDHKNLILNKLINRDRLLPPNGKPTRNKHFIGPIYTEENTDRFFNFLDKFGLQLRQKTKKLYWLAPTDRLWGRSSLLTDFIERLIGIKNLEPRFFIQAKDARWGDITTLFSKKQIHDLHFYGVKEGEILKGNFEIILLEDSFCIMICHVRDCEINPITIPIGTFTQDGDVVAYYQALLHSLEVDSEQFCKGIQGLGRIGFRQ